MSPISIHALYNVLYIHLVCFGLLQSCAVDFFVLFAANFILSMIVLFSARQILIFFERAVNKLTTNSNTHANKIQITSFHFLFLNLLQIL